MTPPQWLLYVLFGLLIIGFLALYRRAGTGFSDSIGPAGGFTLLLLAIISGADAIWHGYMALHAAPTWAHVLTVVHLTLMVATFAYGTYVGQAYVLAEDGHLPDYERKRRYLRARAWNWRRFVLAMLAVLVFMLGYPTPAREKWAVVADLKWLIPYAIVWVIASSVFAAMLRAAREEPSGVGENSSAYASLLVILLWAFPLARRGMEVLGIATTWTWIIACVLLVVLIPVLVVAVFVITAYLNGISSGRGAGTIAVVGGIALLLYLLPLIWNDRPVVHDLTDITGIPFVG